MTDHADQRTRRAFLRVSAGALAARMAAPAQARKRFMIDSHQHWSNAPDYVARLVKTYGPRNTMACVNAFYADWPKLIQAAKQHPDVIIPYGRISVDDRDAPNQIERMAGEGARGIKMHTPHFDWDQPGYFPLYERIDRLKLVALFHTGIASHIDRPEYTSMARMRPEYLDTIARAFPNLFIQGAHLGNPWYDAAAEAARWCPKLYFDVTGSSLTKKAKNLSTFRDYLWWEGPQLHSSPHAVPAFEKIVFGTDEEPEHLDEVVARHEAMLNACEVPESSRKKIYSDTLAKALGITPK
jgi:predicted TIM-barrel fold metal-dependent hydrolase